MHSKGGPRGSRLIQSISFSFSAIVPIGVTAACFVCLQLFNLLSRQTGILSDDVNGNA